MKKVTSSHAKGQTVIVSEEPLDAEALRGVIAQTGYELKDIQTETVEKKPFRLFHKG